MKKRVLIIDDEKAFAELVAMNLEGSADVEVRCVCDPLNSIAEASVWKPDVILLDLIMPGINGEEIYIQLQQRADLKDIPIIFMSASVNANRIIEGENVDHLPKPMSVDSLLETIYHRVGLEGSEATDSVVAPSPALSLNY
ncbi:MAG: CheY-like chemotaxis protein [Verrucomicrobiales bacterium]|jgi:CheY-like chemotaxis protein